MNIDAIYHSLLNNSFSDYAIVRLTELAEKYPYCQALHYARLKWLRESNHVEYNDYLKHAAAYAGDRDYLFSLINDNKEVMEKSSLLYEPEVSEATIGLPLETLLETNVAPTLHDKNEDRLQQIIDERLRELNLLRTAPSPEFRIDDFMLQLEEQSRSTEVTPGDVIQFEEPTINEAVVPDASSELPEAQAEIVDIDEIKSQDNEPAPLKTLEKEPVAELEKLAQSDDPIDQLIGNHAILERLSPVISIQPISEALSTDQPKSFSEWLRAIKKPISNDAIHPKTLSTPKGGIIEKFIREEPRITPSRSTFYSPVNKARESITEHDDLVSETLARIYSMQGNIDKAISTYEKLSLQHPEKSAYFVALILELKQKQNI